MLQSLLLCMLSEQAAFGAQPASSKCQANTATVLSPEHCSLCLRERGSPHSHAQIIQVTCSCLHAPGCGYKSYTNDSSNSFPEFQTVVLWVITPYTCRLVGGYQRICGVLASMYPEDGGSRFLRNSGNQLSD
jgi:hypothetical protein